MKVFALLVVVVFICMTYLDIENDCRFAWPC